MEIIFILIAFSFMLALGFLGAFFWAVRNRQYEDSYSPSVRMLFDDLKTKPKSFNKPVKNNPIETKNQSNG